MFKEITTENIWKVNLIQELVNLKQKNLIVDDKENTFSDEELNDILEFVCTT